MTEIEGTLEEMVKKKTEREKLEKLWDEWIEEQEEFDFGEGNFGEFIED